MSCEPAGKTSRCRLFQNFQHAHALPHIKNPAVPFIGWRLEACGRPNSSAALPPDSKYADCKMSPYTRERFPIYPVQSRAQIDKFYVGFSYAFDI